MPTTPSITSRPYTPHGHLQPYVTAYLYNEVTITDKEQTVDLFPVGHSVLSFSMDELPLFFKGKLVANNYNITGQLTQNYKMGTVPGVYKTVMVLLKPYAAYRFFGSNQHALVNTFEDLNATHPPFATLDRLLKKTKSHEVMIGLVDGWLLGLLSAQKVSHKSVTVEAICNRIMLENGNTLIGSLHEEYQLSKSTLERHFKEVVGIAPKLFNRIVRFNHAYQTICSGQYNSWHDVVNDHGYFDQAHFIKEFKSFYGYTPSQLHQSMLSIAGHVKNITL